MDTLLGLDNAALLEANLDRSIEDLVADLERIAGRKLLGDLAPS